jgi:hypothetical protein
MWQGRPSPGADVERVRFPGSLGSLLSLHDLNRRFLQHTHCARRCATAAQLDVIGDWNGRRAAHAHRAEGGWRCLSGHRFSETRTKGHTAQPWQDEPNGCGSRTSAAGPAHICAGTRQSADGHERHITRTPRLTCVPRGKEGRRPALSVERGLAGQARTYLGCAAGLLRLESASLDAGSLIR